MRSIEFRYKSGNLTVNRVLLNNKLLSDAREKSEITEIIYTTLKSWVESDIKRLCHHQSGPEVHILIHYLLPLICSNFLPHR